MHWLGLLELISRPGGTNANNVIDVGDILLYRCFRGSCCLAGLSSRAEQGSAGQGLRPPLASAYECIVKIQLLDLFIDYEPTVHQG